MCCEFHFAIMDNFYDSEDDYSNLFITQEAKKESCVSLEEDGDDVVEFRSVLDLQYSDISDTEEQAREKRLR